MSKLFETIAGVAGAAADTATKAAGTLVDKGKAAAQRKTLENKLKTSQRQLGILAYSMHKLGEENPSLFERYIEEIDQIKEQLKQLEKADDEKLSVYICPECGKEAKSDATFCSGCGAKLSKKED